MTLAAAPARRHRSLGEQLGRSTTTMHASWMAGVAVLLGGGLTAINPAGAVLLVVVFLPIVVAYRRDRLSFPILFATLCGWGWPWAMWRACSRQPRAGA